MTGWPVLVSCPEHQYPCRAAPVNGPGHDRRRQKSNPPSSMRERPAFDPWGLREGRQILIEHACLPFGRIVVKTNHEYPSTHSSSNDRAETRLAPCTRCAQIVKFKRRVRGNGSNEDPHRILRILKLRTSRLPCEGLSDRKTWCRRRIGRGAWWRVRHRRRWRAQVFQARNRTISDRGRPRHNSLSRVTRVSLRDRRRIDPRMNRVGFRTPVRPRRMQRRGAHSASTRWRRA